MKLIIDGKTYTGMYNGINELIISLDNEVDVRFFKTWENKRTAVKLKKNHVKDIPVFKAGEHGILRSCFPILNSNETAVKIVYDCYTNRIIELDV